MSTLAGARQDLFERSGVREIVELAAAAQRTSSGFSIVRLGDGEGPMLCLPENPRPNELAVVLETWFGRSDQPPAELQFMADGLRQAVRSADVVGLPTRYQFGKSVRYEMVFDALARDRLCSSAQLICDAGMHWYLQWSGALACLLDGLDWLGVIGCRDIGPQIAEAFHIREVRTVLVRGERAYPGPVVVPHWPDGFEAVMAGLTEVRPGMTYLVGAGLLGKIYCDQIKAHGGVALDVGSLLDSWAIIPSRSSFITTSPAFTLEHFRTVGKDWDERMAMLAKCKNELHGWDTTTTF